MDLSIVVDGFVYCNAPGTGKVPYVHFRVGAQILRFVSGTHSEKFENLSSDPAILKIFHPFR